eukprot:360874-Chlamydomonas_euryale.AAC.33
MDPFIRSYMSRSQVGEAALVWSSIGSPSAADCVQAVALLRCPLKRLSIGLTGATPSHRVCCSTQLAPTQQSGSWHLQSIPFRGLWTVFREYAASKQHVAALSSCRRARSAAQSVDRQSLVASAARAAEVHHGNHWPAAVGTVNLSELQMSLVISCRMLGAPSNAARLTRHHNAQRS